MARVSLLAFLIFFFLASTETGAHTRSAAARLQRTIFGMFIYFISAGTNRIGPERSFVNIFSSVIPGGDISIGRGVSEASDAFSEPRQRAASLSARERAVLAPI